MSVTFTLNKSSSGAFFRVTSQTGQFQDIPCNTCIPEADTSAGTFSLWNLVRHEYVLGLQFIPATSILNGDSSNAPFASLAALVTYVEANFFRNAGSVTSALSAANFATGSLTGTIDGSNRAFVIPQSGALSLISIYSNGILQLLGTHYTYNAGTKTVTFTTAPDAGPPADLLQFTCITQ